MDRKTFEQLLSKYSHLGKKYIEETGATMIGHAPHIAPEAYFNMAFEPLSKEEISQLEGRLHEIIPDPYKDFLMNVSNGATVCCELFLYGYRRYSDKDKGIIYVFKPYDLEDINCRDWITKPSPNMFFFGSYDWNGDELYMDRESLEIVLCSTPDLTPLYKWKSFDDFLQEEVNRLYTMFDENGVQLDESSSPLPVNKKKLGEEGFNLGTEILEQGRKLKLSLTDRVIDKALDTSKETDKQNEGRDEE